MYTYYAAKSLLQSFFRVGSSVGGPLRELFNANYVAADCRDWRPEVMEFDVYGFYLFILQSCGTENRYSQIDLTKVL